MSHGASRQGGLGWALLGLVGGGPGLAGLSLAVAGWGESQALGWAKASL